PAAIRGTRADKTRRRARSPCTPQYRSGCCHVLVQAYSPRCGDSIRTLEPLGLFTIFVELFAKLGMRDFNQGLGALADRLAVQVGDAVFGDDVANEAARCDDASAGGKRGHDARDRVVFGGGGKGDDGLAAVGARSSAQEVHLATDAAVEMV